MRNGIDNGEPNGDPNGILNTSNYQVKLLGVTRDTTSGIYTPASWTEWQTVLTASQLTTQNAPYGLYLCQETTGNLTDTLGAAGAATVNNSPQYSVAIPGWTRLGLGFAAASTAPAFLSVSPMPFSTTSWLGISYSAVSAVPSQGSVGVNIRGSATVNTSANIQLTASLIVNDDGASVTGSLAYGTTLRPFVLKYDKTNSKVTAYTDQERISTPTFVALAGNSVAIGADPGVFANTQHTASYVVMFSGSAAELSDSQVRVLLGNLGWSPAW